MMNKMNNTGKETAHELFNRDIRIAGRIYAAFAAGSGITPILSMAKSVLAAAARRSRLVTDSEAARAGANVAISLDGVRTDFTLGADEGSILDAALGERPDLPYACKGGMCCTCRAKVLEGRVEMDLNYRLAEDEVKRGFVLTCQSHPASETVVLDFDAR